MELFTLGRGNYSEIDVKEAARAFTGWGFNLRGEFVFRRFQHDNGSKTILGRTGNFDGDDVLNILLEQKPLAKFITRKAYRFFVNDTIDGHHVEWLAGRFYQSGYDISALMNDIFSSDWFYEQKNIGCIIKSPVALLAGMNRMLPADFENEAVLLQMQRALGQVLFYPPNVAGWPGGTSWIDSSALMLRLRLPQFIAGSEVFSIQNKSDDDQQMGRMETMVNNQFANMQKRFKSNVNWPKFIQQFDSVPRQHLYDVLEAVLLQPPPDSVNRASVDRVANASTRESYISSVAVALMSTPEYQLC
jgi:uncharacterized protein (DUF1800 family)